MADHVRTQIRDAAKTLVTGLTTTTSHVFPGRPETHPLQDAELPALLLYTNDTESEPIAGAQGARRIEQVCDLMITGVAKGTGDVDKTLDTIEKEVRAALEAAPTLSGLCKDLYFSACEKKQEPDAEQPTMQIEMTFRCEYHTREGAPDAALA